ncbi:MAG: thiamine pyrophosphate-binding protein [Dehalococcoidia bacterium]|jgi:acetolactate synthase-1/2/3 large subunit|nr:thiamine pyrophosphate-binding protein [Dehalococcoidia bacterium]
MTIDVATGIARILKQENIPWVSTFPVSRVNNSFGREGLKLLMMRDDRYAVSVADSYSRVNNGNKIGVCTFSGGINAAGEQVAYSGIAQAYEDGSPVLCIVDAVPAGSTQNTRFDQDASLRGVAKWYGYIDKPERTPEFLRRAFTMLRSGRPGPVVLGIPDAAATYDETVDPYRSPKGWRSLPDPEDIHIAVDELSRAKNPLLFVGEGVLYSNATDELKAFAEKANLPVVTSLKAKGAFPENHPLSVGVRGDHVLKFMDDADVVLAIGASISPGRFGHGIPDAVNKKIIQCNIDEFDVNRMYPTHHAVIGDAKVTLTSLTAAIDGNSGRADVTPTVKSIKDEAMAQYRKVMESDTKPINPYRVYGDLMKVLDRNNSFVTHESGNTRDQLSTAYETLIPRGFLGWGNVSSLGYSFPAVVGAKLAHPDRQCVAVIGDAALSYMLGNLEVLTRLELGITIVHINNGGFSGYGPGFWGEGHDPYTFDVSGSDVINMTAAIENIGWQTERVTEPGEISAALERAFAANRSNKPAYIEVIASQYPVYGDWAG